MNFGEWTEKRRETAVAVSPSVPKLSSFGEWTEQKRSTGGSFGSLRGTVSRTGGRGGGTVTTPASVMDYDSEMSRLGEQKRQATVDMDFDAVNAADNAMKLLRAQEGKQTLGDRVGDVVGAAAASTLGSIADTVNTLWELAGGDADDRLADIAAEDSARFTRSAKAGLGKAGQFAVDTGISGLHLLGDAAANALVPGSGLALTGARSFGSSAREAKERDATVGQQAAYGLGSAATGMLTEKLGNTGLLKSAYGSGWLDRESLGTLGRLAYSAVSEGAEEFAEGLAQPLLKRLTYDPDAVYDDDWFSDTLYDSAVGATLGGLGGAVDVEAGDNGQKKATSGSEVGRANYDEFQATLIRGEHKTFRNLIAGIDTKVSEFFRKWQGGRNGNSGEKLEKLYLGRLTPSVIEEVADIVGYDIDIRDIIVTNDDVKHIFDHHGDDEAEIQRGNIPLEEWMFDKLPELVSSPDNIKAGNLGRGKRNAGKRAVLFSKEFPEGTVITVQFDNKGRKTMEITTLYARKKGTPSKPYASADAETSAGRPKRLEPVPFEDSIP